MGLVPFNVSALRLVGAESNPEESASKEGSVLDKSSAKMSPAASSEGSTSLKENEVDYLLMLI